MQSDNYTVVLMFILKCIKIGNVDTIVSSAVDINTRIKQRTMLILILFQIHKQYAVRPWTGGQLVEAGRNLWGSGWLWVVLEVDGC